MTTPDSAALDQPLYGASFGQAVVRVFRKYATFSGRASRSEYWWWALATGLVYVGVTIVALVVGYGTGELNADGDVFYLGSAVIIGIVVLSLWSLGTLIPQLALGFRRLHDADLSGWLLLLRLVPSVGDLVLLILFLLPTNPAGARFDKR